MLVIVCWSQVAGFWQITPRKQPPASPLLPAPDGAGVDWARAGTGLASTRSSEMKISRSGGVQTRGRKSMQVASQLLVTPWTPGVSKDTSQAWIGPAPAACPEPLASVGF